MPVDVDDANERIGRRVVGGRNDGGKEPQDPARAVLNDNGKHLLGTSYWLLLPTTNSFSRPHVYSASKGGPSQTHTVCHWQ